MNRHALKTLQELKRLREMREQRAYEALNHSRAQASEAATRVNGLETQIASTRADAIRTEREALDRSVGTAMSLSDLSRLQSQFVAEEKKLARLGSDLDAAVETQTRAANILAESKVEYRLRQKAHTKIGAARDEAKRKLDRHRLIVEEVIAEDAATSEGRRR